METDTSPKVEHVNTLETDSTVEPSKNSISDKVELYFLQKENGDLKKPNIFSYSHPFGYHLVESDDKMFEFYCGITVQVKLCLILL